MPGFKINPRTPLLSPPGRTEWLPRLRLLRIRPPPGRRTLNSNSPKRSSSKLSSSWSRLSLIVLFSPDWERFFYHLGMEYAAAIDACPPSSCRYEVMRSRSLNWTVSRPLEWVSPNPPVVFFLSSSYLLRDLVAIILEWWVELSSWICRSRKPEWMDGRSKSRDLFDGNIRVIESP